MRDNRQKTFVKILTIGNQQLSTKKITTFGIQLINHEKTPVYRPFGFGACNFIMCQHKKHHTEY